MKPILRFLDRVNRTVLIAIALLLPSAMALADFSSGMAAYKQRDYATAMPILKTEAENGNKIAQNLVGVMYMQGGGGVSQDDAEAMRWFRMGADQGYAVAQTNVGFLYQSGRSVPRDLVEAKLWFERAAAQGDERARIFLQTMPLQSPQSTTLPTPRIPDPSLSAPPKGVGPIAETARLQEKQVNTVPSEPPRKKAQPIDPTDRVMLSPNYLLAFLVMTVSIVLLYWSQCGWKDQSLPRPTPVSIASTFLWISMLLGPIKLAIAFRDVVANFQRASTVFLAAVIIGIYSHLVFKAVTGKRWARMLLLILVCLAFFPRAMLIVWEMHTPGSTGTFLPVGQVLLEIVAMFLLFRESANQWYEDCRAQS